MLTDLVTNINMSRDVLTSKAQHSYTHMQVIDRANGIGREHM